MAAIHETAYPRIKPNLTKEELKEIFAPTEEELVLLNANTKKTLPMPRLGFMTTLKCYQYLGRAVSARKIDPPILKYIAEVLYIDPLTHLDDYSKQAQHRHLKKIRAYLQINTDKSERKKIMKEAALDAAKKKRKSSRYCELHN
jgi:hypothetical protein